MLSRSTDNGTVFNSVTKKYSFNFICSTTNSITVIAKVRIAIIGLSD